MSGVRYRRGGMYAADMAVYARGLSEENTNAATLNTLKRNLTMALRQEVTHRQLECIRLYYAEGLNMGQIGRRLGVDKSTVSRNLKRGEANLRRCLRFGAAELLDTAGVKAPHRAVRQRAKREGYENG